MVCRWCAGIHAAVGGASWCADIAECGTTGGSDTTGGSGTAGGMQVLPQPRVVWPQIPETA